MIYVRVVSYRLCDDTSNGDFVKTARVSRASPRFDSTFTVEHLSRRRFILRAQQCEARAKSARAFRSLGAEVARGREMPQMRPSQYPPLPILGYKSPCSSRTLMIHIPDV